MAKKKKPEVVVDDQHGTLIEWVNEADDATLATRDLAEKSRSYYDTYGQWTDAERAKLEKQKQAATIINRIKPKMDGLMGMERANRTTVKAFARTPKHEKSATAATEAIRYVLQDNFYDQTRSSAWENLLIEGTCGIEVIVKPKKDDYKIIIRPIMWDRLIYDPHSRSKSFGDNPRYMGQVIWMDYDDAVLMYPDAKDVLETMVSGSQTYDDKPRWIDPVRKRVKIVEMYYREKGEIYYACLTRGGYCETPKVCTYKNEDGETEWPYEFASLFVDREGGRYGACRQLLDVQDEINKRRSKALHLMSVRQIMLERGSVEDVNKVRQELAKPDGVVEVTPGMLFEVLKTGDMAQAQFNLLAEAKSEIDSVSYNAAAAGKEVRNLSGVALRSREQAAQTELAPMFDVLKHLDIRVYRKVWNRIKQYWKAEKWVRVTDDENNLKWVGLNKPMTKGEMMLQQAQEKGAPPEALQQMQQQIAQDPMMQEVVSTENEISDLDVDIIIDDAPDTISSQIEDFQVLGEMVKSGFPMPPLAVIEASPLNNKDKIIKMMKEQPQMSPEHQKQMEQMQEQGQKLQEELQKSTQENQTLKMGQQETQMKIQADSQASMAELQLKAQAQKETLMLQKEKVDAEIALKQAVAEADYQIEQRKLAQQNDFKMKEINFQHECRMKDEQNNDEATMMPQAVGALDKLTEAFANIDQILQQQTMIQAKTLDAQGAILEAIQRPKSVHIGGVQKDANGAVIGATVSTTLQ